MTFLQTFSLKTQIHSWFFCHFRSSSDFLQDVSIVTFWFGLFLETKYNQILARPSWEIYHVMIIVFHDSDACHYLISKSLKRHEISVWLWLMDITDTGTNLNFCFAYALLLRNCLLCRIISSVLVKTLSVRITRPAQYQLLFQMLFTFLKTKKFVKLTSFVIFWK